MSTSLSQRNIIAPLLKLGIFVLVTSMAIIVLGNTIRGANAGGGEEYHAIFSDATMSAPGDEVRIAGVRVGRVTKVELWERDQARVTFHLSGRDALPENTHATLRFRNMIGQRYVALSPEPGPPGPAMQPGDTIGLDHTTPSVNLTTLFNGFRPLFTELQPADVNRLSESLIRVLQGEGGTVRQLVSDIGQLTTTLANRDTVIGEVITNLTTVLETINNRDEQFSELVTTTSSLIDGLAGDSTEIGDSIDALADLTAVSENIVSNTRPQLTASIDALGTVATDLNTNRGTVESVLSTMPVKTDKLIRIGSFGSWFQFYLCGIDITTGPGLAENIVPPAIPVINQPIYTNSAPRCHASASHGGGSSGS